jgi:hypothetical protein
MFLCWSSTETFEFTNISFSTQEMILHNTYVFATLFSLSDQNLLEAGAIHLFGSSLHNNELTDKMDLARIIVG